MKIFLILMIMFSDGTATLQTRQPVPGSDPKVCVGMVWGMMVENTPGSKWQGHPIKSWSAGCVVEGIGDPT